MTTYGATCDDKVVKLTTFCFQWNIQENQVHIVGADALAFVSPGH